MMRHLSKLVAFIFIGVFAVAFNAAADDYQDYLDKLEAKNQKIEECGTIIAEKQALIAEEQSGIDDDKKSIEQTQKIYTIGLEKYKAMEDEVRNIKKTFDGLRSNLFVLRISYEDFFNAYESYKNAWFDKNYSKMSIEYKKMWHYIHGFEGTPPMMILCLVFMMRA